MNYVIDWLIDWLIDWSHSSCTTFTQPRRHTAKLDSYQQVKQFTNNTSYEADFPALALFAKKYKGEFEVPNKFRIEVCIGD